MSCTCDRPIFRSVQLLMDAILLALRFNRDEFQLGRDGSVCVDISVSSSAERSRGCFRSMKESAVPLDGGVFTAFINCEGFTVPTSIRLSLTAMSLVGDSVLYEAHRDITVRSYHHIRALRLSKEKPASGEDSSVSRVVGDSTVLNKYESDILRMRFREHSADVMVLDDTNTFYSGAVKGYVINGPQNTSTSSPTEVIYEISADTFSHESGIEKQWVVNKPRIVVNQRDTTHWPNCTDRLEWMQRDSIAASARWITNTEGTGVRPDLYIVSDPDEILSKETVEILKTETDIQPEPQNLTFQMETVYLATLTHYVLQFNWQMDGEFGISSREGAMVLPASLVESLAVTPEDGALTATKIRRMLRFENTDALVALLARYNLGIWRSAGWHLSSFRTPAEESLVKQSYTCAFSDNNLISFFSEDVCSTMREIGAPAYVVVDSGPCEVAANLLPKHIETSSLVSNVTCNIPVAACDDWELLNRFISDSAPKFLHRKQILCELQKKIPSKGTVQYHVPADAGSWYEFSCSHERLPDKDEIDRVLFCDGCPFESSLASREAAYKLVAHNCKASYDTSYVQLQVVPSD